MPRRCLPALLTPKTDGGPTQGNPTPLEIHGPAPCGVAFQANAAPDKKKSRADLRENSSTDDTGRKCQGRDRSELLRRNVGLVAAVTTVR